VGHSQLRNHRQSRSAKNDAPRQNRAPDRRSYEERSLEELHERGWLRLPAPAGTLSEIAGSWMRPM
jgi:hypothetical protein